MYRIACPCLAFPATQLRVKLFPVDTSVSFPPSTSDFCHLLKGHAPVLPAIARVHNVSQPDFDRVCASLTAPQMGRTATRAPPVESDGDPMSDSDSAGAPPAAGRSAGRPVGRPPGRKASAASPGNGDGNGVASPGGQKKRGRPKGKANAAPGSKAVKTGARAAAAEAASLGQTETHESDAMLAHASNRSFACPLPRRPAAGACRLSGFASFRHLCVVFSL